MSTSVKMREPAKRRLDRLQSTLQARSGRKVTQQDLLERLLELADEHQDRLLAGLRRVRRRSNLKKLLSLPVATGVVTREEDIDRDLYGGSS